MSDNVLNPSKKNFIVALIIGVIIDAIFLGFAIKFPSEEFFIRALIFFLFCLVAIITIGMLGHLADDFKWAKILKSEDIFPKDNEEGYNAEH